MILFLEINIDFNVFNLTGMQGIVRGEGFISSQKMMFQKPF